MHLQLPSRAASMGYCPRRFRYSYPRPWPSDERTKALFSPFAIGPVKLPSFLVIVNQFVFYGAARGHCKKAHDKGKAPERHHRLVEAWAGFRLGTWNISRSFLHAHTYTGMYLYEWILTLYARRRTRNWNSNPNQIPPKSCAPLLFAPKAEVAVPSRRRVHPRRPAAQNRVALIHGCARVANRPRPQAHLFLPRTPATTAHESGGDA